MDLVMCVWCLCLHIILRENGHKSFKTSAPFMGATVGGPNAPSLASFCAFYWQAYVRSHPIN